LSNCLKTNSPRWPRREDRRHRCDHGGYLLKRSLKPILEGLGLEVRDVRCVDEKPADYPDLALKVAELVAAARLRAAWSSMARASAPPSRPIRCRASAAALCYDKLPLEIAGNIMILMCLHSAPGS